MANRPGKAKGWIWILLGILALVALGVVVWVVVPPAFDETMPEPNGYDDLIAAAWNIETEIPSTEGRNGSPVDPETFRPLVAANLQVLERARVGLSRESRVRLPKVFMDPKYLENMNKLRNLARLFACEAAVAERDGDVFRAAQIDLDLIRLGRNAGEGGLLIDHLVGMAIESLGMSGLSRLAPSLPAETARRVAAELSTLDGKHETSPEVIKRDFAYARARGDLHGRVIMAVAPGFVQKMNKAAESAAVQSDLRSTAWRRLLILKLALQAYRADHPDAPVPPSLDALVPTYLGALPIDPFGKGPLKLHVEEGGKQAHGYSVGPDGKDNGGTPVPKPAATLWKPGATGDLTLDLP